MALRWITGGRIINKVEERLWSTLKTWALAQSPTNFPLNNSSEDYWSSLLNFSMRTPSINMSKLKIQLTSRAWSYSLYFLNLLWFYSGKLMIIGSPLLIQQIIIDSQQPKMDKDMFKPVSIDNLTLPNLHIKWNIITVQYRCHNL